MKELMVHVERIVRPVRAVQRRKLRMRRELLAHLQSAFDEERAAGGDEAAALQRAKERLGDPRDLTVSLQRSVPWLERTLMMRVPGVSALDRLEEFSVPVWGADRRMTMLHSGLIILPGVILGYLALLLAVLVLSPKEMLTAMVERPRAASVMTLLNVVCIVGLVIVTSQFMFAVTRGERPRLQYLRMIIVALMPTVVMTIVVVATARRSPMPLEFARSIIIGTSLLLSTMALAQVVARLRRPYDPWLTLDIAE